MDKINQYEHELLAYATKVVEPIEGVRIIRSFEGNSLSDIEPADLPQITRAIEMAMKKAGVKPDRIDYINAHGTSTQLNDKIETMVIKRVFGERAYEIPVSATKSMVGHLIGAAGSVELIATVLAMENEMIPPTINYEVPDPECDLDYVPNQARPAKIEIAMKNSFGFGGKNSILIIAKP